MSSFPIPKIVYPSGGGSTLLFLRQPRQVDFDNRTAVRDDNIASSGVQETIYQRTDIFLTFTMEYVNSSTDVTSWQTFIESAEQGLPFDYYPDSSSGTFVTYFLVGTNWTAKYKQLGMYTFDVKFRKRVAWP